MMTSSSSHLFSDSSFFLSFSLSLSKLELKILQNFTTPESNSKSSNGDLFMSESEHREHESELCDGGNGGEDDEEDKEREDGGGEGGENRRKGVLRTSNDFKSAIKRPFRKRKKEKERGDGEIVRIPSARRRGRRIQWAGSCYVCFLRPRTEESPETPTSDPNSETFNFEMLRTLIENNDFFCRECNPHI